MEIFKALKILRKLIKLGDTTKIKATIDDKPLDKTDVDFHLLMGVLEAWRANPQEYYRCEFSYMHPKMPELKINGNERFKETADVDLHLKEITLEIRFCDSPTDEPTQHLLKFVYPYI